MLENNKIFRHIEIDKEEELTKTLNKIFEEIIIKSIYITTI
jgi:hypothetical protein